MTGLLLGFFAGGGLLPVSKSRSFDWAQNVGMILTLGDLGCDYVGAVAARRHSAFDTCRGNDCGAHDTGRKGLK